jgi:hypothetical protein
MIMVNQYIKNGNFIKKLEHWTQGPEPFDPQFKPHGDGNSIHLPISASLQQPFPEMPGKTMRLEFEVRSAQPDVDQAMFTVSVGGFNSDGAAQVSPVSGLASSEWQTYSVRVYFQRPLKHCFLMASLPSPALIKGQQAPSVAPALAAVRFANFRLFEEPKA